MEHDLFTKILMTFIIILMTSMIVGVPAIMSWNYYLETRCVNSGSVKSNECFELFVRTGKNVNHNIQTWEK